MAILHEIVMCVMCARNQATMPGNVQSRGKGAGTAGVAVPTTGTTADMIKGATAAVAQTDLTTAQVAGNERRT
jgi:hypothetical protein